ncbi:MAG: hypothetical protein ACMVO3_20515 [Thalassobaculum sp.]
MTVQAEGLGAAELKVDLQMILQVAADTRPVGDYRDAVVFEFRGRADARSLQDRGRAD